jgi:flavin-dependent dehydrogenase
MPASTAHFDVLIAGAGPAGATAAMVLARRGLRTLIVEKAPFPRFQIGESFLPANFQLIEKLGLLDRLRGLPHMVKLGAELGMGGSLDTTLLRFATGLVGGRNETFNIARADFDQMLLAAALDAGAQLAQPATIKEITRLADDDVAVVTDDGRAITARYMIDATGHATLLGRHLGTRRMLDDRHLRKVAYFNHFERVRRLPGECAGMPTIVMCEEGWFWIIPLNERVTSVGLVLEPDGARKAGVAADRMLRWGIDRCPLVADRMREATGAGTNLVRADFSYRCEPFAGPGYFMVGDAALFLDPVFSTGVCVGMEGAVRAAEHLTAMLRGEAAPAASRRDYVRTMSRATRWFVRAIELFYDHSFREMLLNGRGPLRVHGAVLAILAGHVFPRPPMSVRWRFQLFEWLLMLHRRTPIVRSREHHSLFNAPPAPILDPADAVLTSLPV